MLALLNRYPILLVAWNLVSGVYGSHYCVVRTVSIEDMSTFGTPTNTSRPHVWNETVFAVASLNSCISQQEVHSHRYYYHEVPSIVVSMPFLEERRRTEALQPGILRRPSERTLPWPQRRSVPTPSFQRCRVMNGIFFGKIRMWCGYHLCTARWLAVRCRLNCVSSLRHDLFGLCGMYVFQYYNGFYY